MGNMVYRMWTELVSPLDTTMETSVRSVLLLASVSLSRNQTVDQVLRSLPYRTADCEHMGYTQVVPLTVTAVL